ncbi:MAG TPA: TIGR01777 family oxidoreductase [Gemmatimonadales bacterium]|nr:TIGR01777 family oxidoreductase [Gemmatimonadales bacterium]
MTLHVVEHTTPLPADADTVFAWHLRPGALERLTPPWERVRVAARDPRGIVEGARVELRVGPGPFALPWAVRHEGIVPGRGFRDVQVAGPFARWVHHHVITPEGDGARLTERIEFAPPLGAAGDLAAPLIRRRLERMLAYRGATLRADLAAHARAARQRGDERPLHLVVTGASGLVGSVLVPFLTTGGHRVTRLVRRTPGPGEARWDPARGTIDAAALEGVDAVIHLAGENLAGGRWTEARKRRLVESRTRSTRLLAEALARLAQPPAALVSVSAVGIYGDRGDEPLDETSAPGADFLARLALAWEAAAAPAAEAGIRVVHPRLGVVLTPAGGALAKLLLPFRLGAGGRLGDGRQWMSCLSIDDAIGILYEAAAGAALAGPVCAVAPAPLTNAEFTRALARTLHRPALLPVPATALRLALGELADAALLASQRVLPHALAAAGYPFRHPTVPAALAHVLGTRTD